MCMNSSGVYRYRNKINGKLYFGKGTVSRAKIHFKFANRIPKKNDSLLVRAIRKYGPENFELTMMFENIPENEAFLIEKFYIRKFKTNVYQHGENAGYNRTDGGEGSLGMVFPEAAKQQLSQLNKGKSSAQKGIPKGPRTLESRNKQSKTTRGRQSPLKGKKRPNISEKLKGRKLSLTHRMNVSKSLKGKHQQSEIDRQNNIRSKITQLTINAIQNIDIINENIKNGQSIADAAHEWSISTSQLQKIRKRCKGTYYEFLCLSRTMKT